MTIMKTKDTYDLPDEISMCTGNVFIMLEDGKLYPVNQNRGICLIFKKLWSCNDLDEVQLFFENDFDAHRILNMMIEGTEAV